MILLNGSYPKPQMGRSECTDSEAESRRWGGFLTLHDPPSAYTPHAPLTPLPEGQQTSSPHSFTLVLITYRGDAALTEPRASVTVNKSSPLLNKPAAKEEGEAAEVYR